MNFDRTQPVLAKPVDQKARIRMLWMVTLALVVTVLFTRPFAAPSTGLHRTFEHTGELMVIFGIIGRLWSTLYVGGRKNAELITKGPYSLTRNPLYLFSMLIVTGASMMTGSLVVSFVFPLLFWAIFLRTAKNEAEFLRHKFGARFDDYASKVPLFWPNFRSFENSDITIQTHALTRTARDSAFLLLIVPANEILEYLQDTGAVSALLSIP